MRSVLEASSNAGQLPTRTHHWRPRKKNKKCIEMMRDLIRKASTEQEYVPAEPPEPLKKTSARQKLKANQTKYVRKMLACLLVALYQVDEEWSSELEGLCDAMDDCRNIEDIKRVLQRP